MAGKSVMFALMQNSRKLSSSRRSFTVARVIYNKPTATSASTQQQSTIWETSSSDIGDGSVPGLSQNVVAESSEPVGPGAGKNTDYKNPEYFLYNNTSYFEAEVEMLKYRCPQPSNKKAFN